MATSQPTTPNLRRRPPGDGVTGSWRTRVGPRPHPRPPAARPAQRTGDVTAGHPPRIRATARITPRPAPPTDTDHAPPAAEQPTNGAPRVQELMRARLAAIAAPRDTDDPELAALRAVLRDEALMAHVRANVDRWPPLTDGQRATVAALLGRRRRPPPR